MAILDTWFGGAEAGEEMARAKSHPVDDAKVEAAVRQIKQVVLDAERFQTTLEHLADGTRFSNQEVIEIALKFLGGAKHKSRKSALGAIARERLRMAHARAKGATAAKARVW